jgi:PAS domain S-box-containing protein
MNESPVSGDVDDDPSPAVTGYSSSLLDSLAEVVIAFDRTGDVTAWNRALRDATGHGDETLSSLSTDDLFVDGERVRERIVDVAAADGSVPERTFEATVCTAADGRRRYEFSATMHDLREGGAAARQGADTDTETGADASVVCVGRTVTSPNDSARDRGFTRYRAILESLPDAVYAIEPDGTIVYVNEAYAAMKGVPRDELLGTDVDEWITDQAVEHADELREELDEGDREVAVLTYEFVTADDTRFPAELRFGRVDDVNEEESEPSGESGLAHVGMIRDVTERVDRERQLRRHNERLDQFAAIVSHDLRNPLNVAEGRLDLAREECESEHLDGVESAHDRMRALIDDLLALARTGQDASDTTTVSLSRLAEFCWDAVPEPNAALDVRTDARVRADESGLKRLLENLFRNSVEHGSTNSRPRAGDSVEHGSPSSRPTSGDSAAHGSTDSRGADDGVTVTVGALSGGSGFYVADDGPGIPPATRDEVFEPGYSTSRTGTGLGLSIVRDVAAAHGWDIELTEADGGGSRFEFRGVTMA